jgi:regulator of protease activity HflC (stomatin/prohibitin superfamily)
MAPDDDFRVNIGKGRQVSAKALWAGFWGVLLIGAVLVSPIWVWYWWRIEPGANQLAVLIRKTGQDLPSGQILASDPNQKGIQLEVLPPGRYFYNPYTWDWQIVPVTDVPAGRLGVVTRLYGKDLPPGQIIASEGTKGIESQVLRPGKYYLNPFAVQVQLFDAITVRPGCVGVKVSLVGADALAADVPINSKGQLTVAAGNKGVLAEVYDPGTYYPNPFEYTIVEVVLQSQRFEMAGEDAISFLTIDGFTVHVEGTIEYALQREMVGELTHRVGDMEDILKKVILPRARGFSRIEGSKSPAINYIVGETRQRFQDNLETHLREQCATWGVLIKSVLVRNITAPQEIASVIRDREVAVQNAKKIEQQIDQAKSQAELTKQEMLAEQNREKVNAETVRLRAVILANQDQAVRVLDAQRALEVAKLELDASTAQAQSIRLSAAAEQEVIRLTNEAEAAVIANQVQAFGSGATLARYELYRRLAPRIGSILTSDTQGGLGEWFRTTTPPPGSPPPTVTRSANTSAASTEGQR